MKFSIECKTVTETLQFALLWAKIMHNATGKQGTAISHTIIETWFYGHEKLIFEVICDEVWLGPSSFSSGERVWFSSCILCIFIAYRIRIILIMHGLNFSPGYIWVFNGSGEKRLPLIIQLFSQWTQKMALSEKTLHLQSHLMCWTFYSSQRLLQIETEWSFILFTLSVVFVSGSTKHC